MGKSKFTPGPWRVEKSEAYKNTWWVIVGENRLARVGGSPTDTKANAELMADAPRMLEVLRTLHDFALPLRDRGLAAESEQAFADARALLEKHCG